MNWISNSGRDVWNTAWSTEAANEQKLLKINLLPQRKTPDQQITSEKLIKQINLWPDFSTGGRKKQNQKYKRGAVSVNAAQRESNKTKVSNFVFINLHT